MRHELKRDMRYHYVCDIIDEADSGHLGSVWFGSGVRLERRKVDRFERRKVDRLERRKVTRTDT
jgi:hypothetical protein